jgi:hypothetical protein
VPRKLKNHALDSLLALLALCAIVGCSATRARAQVTYTIPQTVTQQLAASGTACSGSTIYNVNNLGQTQHFLIAQASSTTSFSMQIWGVDGNGNASLISDVSQAAGYSSPIILQASGYFPKIQAVVTCQGGTYGLTYSGTSGQPVPPVGAYLETQIDKTIFAGVSATLNQVGDQYVTPFGSSAGLLSFIYSNGSGSTGGKITVSCLSAEGGPNASSFSFTLANNINTQNFVTPDFPCPQFVMGYTSGTGAVGTFSLEYIFTNPGRAAAATAAALNSPINDAAQIAEKGARWSAISAPAAGTQATVTEAGVTGTYHVVDCVSYSAGAITAPTATALQIEVLNNATPIWEITVAIPATTGTHANGNVCGLNLIGGSGLSMAAQFSAGLTNESESITMTGYDVQ